MRKAGVTKNQGKPTLRDVAEAADCSVALASHILNKSYGNISCTEELRQKIERVAEELGYASMRSKYLPIASRSYNIGVNIAGIEHNDAQIKLLAELEKLASSIGYTLVVFGYAATIKESTDFFKKKIKQSQIDLVVDIAGTIEQELSLLTPNLVHSGDDIISRCTHMLSTFANA